MRATTVSILCETDEEFSSSVIIDFGLTRAGYMT